MINPETLPSADSFVSGVVTGCYRHLNRFCSLGGGGSSGGTNTVTQTQQVPAYVQQESQSNQDLANSLASQPYPNYQGQLIAPLNLSQQYGIGLANGAANAYQPGLSAATNATQGALNPSLNANGALNAPGAQINSAGAIGAIGPNPTVGASQTYGAAGLQGATGNNLANYMSPYVMQSLAPQLQQLQNQFGQQQNQLGAQATQAGAFGDARQGAEQANNNFNNNILQNGVVAQGLNTAYGQAQNAFQADQANKLSAYDTGLQGNLNEQNTQLNAFNSALQGNQGQQNINLNAFNTALQGGQNEQNIQLAGGNQLGNLAGQAQSLGLTGANAIYNGGQQIQNQDQSALNTAYQQYQNQVNWPAQGLALRESAISNNPYTIQNSVSLPNANGTAQNLGAFSSLAGGLGSLLGSGSGSSSGAKL